jgi:hypothetical protein
VCSSDLELRFVWCNKSFAKHHGFEDPRQLLGKTDFDLWPESDFPGQAAKYQADDRALLSAVVAAATKSVYTHSSSPQPKKIGSAKEQVDSTIIGLNVKTQRAKVLGSDSECLGELGALFSQRKHLGSCPVHERIILVDSKNDPNPLDPSVQIPA